jgi:prepilin-type N-terminal cleavage/methylation domain-containing protein
MRPVYEKQKSEIGDRGFTLVEVIVAASIMIILCIGTVTVYTYVVRINQGNNLRSQAQSVLQAEAEYYRSLKFVPIGSDTGLNAGTYARPNRTSADGTVFTLSVVITNKPLIGGAASDDTTATLKEIQITAAPLVARTGWLSNLRTNLTMQRVRAN